MAPVTKRSAPGGKTSGKEPARAAARPKAAAARAKGGGDDDDDKDDGKAGKGGGAPRDDRGKRLLDLVVMLLGARAPVPYREIKEQFRAYKTEHDEAGMRAFERDKAELLELGVPLRYVPPEEEEGLDDGGYVIDLRKYRLPELRLTPEEVSALLLAGSIARAAAGTTYGDVVDLAIKKLAFDLPEAPDTPRARPRSEPVLVHFPDKRAGGEVSEALALLEQAIRNLKRVTFRYTTAQTGEVLERSVDPYGLAYRQGAWMLVAFCHLRKDVRNFRVDRMAELGVAPKPRTPDFELPAGFDVRRHADRSPWTFATEPPVEVELELAASAAAIVNEDFGDGAVRTPVAGGATRLTFRCPNPAYLVSRVLAAKGGILVRSPAELRARVAAEASALEARYA